MKLLSLPYKRERDMKLKAPEPIEYKHVNVLDKENETISKKIVQQPPNNSNFTLGRRGEQTEFKFKAANVVKSP